MTTSQSTKPMHSVTPLQSVLRVHSALSTSAVEVRDREQAASGLVHFSNVSFKHRSHDQNWLFDDLNLSINQDEIVCLMGPSGCGKSTLLDLIAKLVEPVKGSVETSKVLSVGYIFQRDALLPWRTVESNIMLAADLKTKSKSDVQWQMKQLMRSFSLAENVAKMYPHQLSGGMRQRVSIIQTLVFDPAIVLLDEPFSALDLHTRLQLQAEFHKMARSANKTVIMVTHEIDEAIAMADRIIVLNASGQVAEEFAVKRSLDCGPEEARELAEFNDLYHAIRVCLRRVMHV